MYAYPPIKLSDPIVVKVENYVERMLKAALPGNYLVDFFPAMMYIPTWLAKWKREGYAWFKRDTDMFLGLVNEVQQGLVGFHQDFAHGKPLIMLVSNLQKDGTRSDCFVAKLLENAQDHDLDPVETAWLAGMML